MLPEAGEGGKDSQGHHERRHHHQDELHAGVTAFIVLPQAAARVSAVFRPLNS